METKSLRTWREILASVGTSPQKKQELATSVGNISVRTIDRWISGQSRPQNHELVRKLAAAIPGDEMRGALTQDFPEAFHRPKQVVSVVEQVSIPSEFYRRVTHAYSHTPPQMRRWTIFSLVSSQMLPHLDPEGRGFIVTYAHRSAGENTSERAILIEEGAGNAFWLTRQIQGTRTTEVEPKLAHIIAAGQPFFVQSCAAAQLSPPSCLVQGDLVQSMGFFPLHRGGITAGGLLLYSAQEDFFTPVRQALIEEYSCLFALAFNDSDFYEVA